jgi:ATP-dependent Clp protease ATP-binding subunit ClpC
VRKVEESIANHEFEKARFYSEEQLIEQENLRAAREQHPINAAQATVTRANLEAVLAPWGQYPCAP